MLLLCRCAAKYDDWSCDNKDTTGRLQQLHVQCSIYTYSRSQQQLKRGFEIGKELSEIIQHGDVDITLSSYKFKQKSR